MFDGVSNCTANKD